MASFASPSIPKAMLVAAPLPLFATALVNDWAYGATFDVQWKNFASWLIVGALVPTGLAILVEGIGAIRRRTGRAVLSLLLWLATFAAGLFNSLVHAKDAWASMPTATIVSVVTTLLALAAAWISLSTPTGRAGGAA